MKVKNIESILTIDRLIFILMVLFVFDQLLPIYRILVWSRLIQLFTVTLLFLLIVKIINKRMLILIPITLMYALNLIYVGFFDASNFILYIYGILISFIPVLFFLNYRNNYRLKSKIMLIVNFTLITTIITTIIGLSIYPEASRVLATFPEKNDPTYVRYTSLNIGGFAFIYSLLPLIPLYFFLNSSKKKVINVLILFGIYIVTFMSQYTTAIVISMFVLLVILLTRVKTTKKVVICIFTVSVLLFMIIQYLNTFIYTFISSIDSPIIQERLFVLYDIIIGNNYNQIGRLNLWMQSITVFINHPILGGWTANIQTYSEHSFILDYLGKFGILGLSILIFYYTSIYVYFYKCKENKKQGYIFLSFFATILIGILNPVNSLLIMGFLVPTLIGIGEKNVYENSLGF